MSWNLFIYKPAPSSDAMLPMGTIELITQALNAAFPALKWPSPTECELNVHRGFELSLEIKNGLVDHLYTRGGYYHLKPLAALCLQQGWHLADCQEGEDLDLQNPYGALCNDPNLVPPHRRHSFREIRIPSHPPTFALIKPTSPQLPTISLTTFTHSENRPAITCQTFPFALHHPPIKPAVFPHLCR